MPRRQSSFFHELFKYRQRESRAPLEDFLTAALIGFVRTLPRERQFEFAANLFVAPSQREMFEELCRRCSEHRWDTQFVLPNSKRPDIVLWLDGTPSIVVENKIWSGISVHQRTAADFVDKQPDQDGGEAEISPREITQLATYGGWLRDMRVGTRWVGSLVLLTHGTAPPHEFHALSDVYGAAPHTCRWSTIRSWLKHFLRSEPMPANAQRSAPAFLATELAAFLEKKGLAMPALKFSDIDVIGTNFASKAALDAAFQEIMATVRTCGDVIRPEDAQPIKYENAYGVVQGWVYLVGDGMPDDTFFGWGLRFPEVSSWWEELRDQLPEENHVFAYIGNDEGDFPAGDIPPDLRPPGWTVAFEGEELIAAAPLSALPAAETLSRALALWVRGQLEALRPALAHIAKG